MGRTADAGVFEPRLLSTCFDVAEGVRGMAVALLKLCDRAREAVDDGANILVLSDRDVSATRAPIPAPLALSAVHQHLVREGV